MTCASLAFGCLVYRLRSRITELCGSGSAWWSLAPYRLFLGEKGNSVLFKKKNHVLHPGWFRALTFPQVFLEHILITIPLDPPSNAAMAACKQSMIIIMSNGDCILCSRSKKIMCCHPGLFRAPTSPQAFLEHILTTITP